MASAFFQLSLQGRDQVADLISTLTSVLLHLMQIARAHEAALDMDIDLSDHPVLLLVAILRWTHHTVNADVAFGEEREDRQESIFRLFDSCSSRIVLSPNTYAGSYSDAANMTAQLATQQLEPKPMTSAPDYSAPSKIEGNARSACSCLHQKLLRHPAALHRQCTHQKHLQLWDLVVTSIHSSDPAYPAYLFSYWADWAQDHYKRPLSRAAPAVQANLQNASVQCNRQLPEDIHGIAAVPGSVQQLRREATYKSL